MQKPRFDCEYKGRRTCAFCGTDDLAWMYYDVRILDNDVCSRCEHAIENKCFTESWSDRNPFVIWILVGMLLQNRGAIRCDTIGEPRMWKHNVAESKINGGRVTMENKGVVDVEVRFPLTGVYSYGNIIEHYPEVKAIFEGQQDE